MVCRDDAILELDESGLGLITPDMIDGGSTGSICAGLSALSLSVETVNCTDAGVKQVDLLGTDSLGCQESCTAEVTVIDPTSLLGESCACDGDDVILGGQLVSDDYKATLQIESDSLVAAGDRVIFQAGERITLSAGFRVEMGGELIARIDKCVAPWSEGLSWQAAVEQQKDNAVLIEGEKESWATKGRQSADEGFQTRVFPNPFQLSFFLELIVAQPTKIEATLHTIHGHVIHRSIRATNLSAGRHLLEIDGAELASGVYLLRIRTKSGERIHRIVRVQ